MRDVFARKIGVLQIRFIFIENSWPIFAKLLGKSTLVFEENHSSTQINFGENFICKILSFTFKKKPNYGLKKLN
jgi:hypothetical protein